jgi:hypothetical protein
MTPQPPKAFDFDDQPEPPAGPAAPAAVPRAFDFGAAEEGAASPSPGAGGPPRALAFDDLPEAPGLSGVPPKAGPAALFDSEDHPAVRDAVALAWADYPLLCEQSAPRLTALFRRILPVKLSLVTQWGEQPLVEQAALLQSVTALVLQFTAMAVPALLDAALESTRPNAGVFDKLFRRRMPPSHYKPALTSAKAQLQQLMADSEAATRTLEESAHTLTLHWVALAVVSTLAGAAADAALRDALEQRRALIQQAVRQAELSLMQMGQVRQQAADLIAQVSSFLTVTLPAIELAQAQNGQ